MSFNVLDVSFLLNLYLNYYQLYMYYQYKYCQQYKYYDMEWPIYGHLSAKKDAVTLTAP